MPQTRIANGYAVDVVLCIDTTFSMDPVLGEVKQGALSFHSRLQDAMARRGMAVEEMRVRVVAFRDYGADGADAIRVTPFYSLPERAPRLAQRIDQLTARGGGDIPESGLEALAVAVQSPWSRRNEENGRLRHIVVLFTDAPAHPLGRHTPELTPVPEISLLRGTRLSFGGRPAAPDPDRDFEAEIDYSSEPYPRTLDELHTQWGREDHDGARIDQSGKRLLVFAPEAGPWREIAETWDKTLFVPSTAGTGLEEIALDEVIATIARSL